VFLLICDRCFAVRRFGGDDEAAALADGWIKKAPPDFGVYGWLCPTCAENPVTMVKRTSTKTR
jgi:hypothetical protein